MSTRPVTRIVRVSTRYTAPANSQLMTNARPSAVKSRWSGPGEGMRTLLISRQVCGFLKSTRSRPSATTIAFEPSGVK